MCNKKSPTCLDFEKGLWLYKENELSSGRMAFWKDHLDGCAECRLEFEEDRWLSELIKDKSLEEIDEKVFERMIEQAVTKKNIFPQNIFDFLEYLKNNSGIYSKAAFASVLAIIALVITLSTRKPVEVKSIPAEILDWNGSALNQKIEDVKNQINFMSEDGWDKEIIRLNESLQKLESETDKYSFNK